MQEKTSKPVIYISYAWNPESDDIVGAIEKEFTKEMCALSGIKMT